MINILLTASVTGGIIIVLWCLTYPLSKKIFKSSWHYTILKITMLFMLLPVSIFTPMINNVFAGLFVKPNIPYISEQIQKISIDTETIDSVNEIFAHIVFPDNSIDGRSWKPDPTQTDTEIEPVKKSVLSIPYLQIIWFSIAVLLFLNGIRKMHKFKKYILNNSNDDVDFETKELFIECKAELKLKGTITLLISDCIKTPLVFGLIKPFIIFPDTNMNIDEKRLALTHEFTHIKNGDLWIKRFASIITSIHWFNPLAYFLSYKISVISEEYCDECVVKTMTKEERLLYGYLILKTVSDVGVPYSKFYSTLSAPTKNLKRRLYNMINIKKSSRSKIFLSIIAAFILFSLAASYSFAANVNEPAASYLPASSKADTKNDAEIYIPEDNENLKNIERLREILKALTQSEHENFEKEIEILREMIEEFEEYKSDFTNFPDMWSVLENGDCINNFEEELAKIRSEFIEIQKAFEMGNRNFYNFNKEELEKIRSEFIEIQKTIGDINFYNFFTFSADSYEELYEMVKNHFDEQIKAGSITQEKADNALKEFVELYENKTTYEQFYLILQELGDTERSFELARLIYIVTIDIEGNIYTR